MATAHHISAIVRCGFKRIWGISQIKVNNSNPKSSTEHALPSEERHEATN